MTAIDKPSDPVKVVRETENVLLLGRDLATQSEIWYSRPTEIEFSFNNICNLKCIMCSKADGEPNHVLPAEEGVPILEQVLPCALHLTPAANSEPLLNDLDLIVDLCRKFDVMLFIFTNGALCTDERFSKIQHFVHRLWFSFDSHVKETYEKIRVGAKFETVVENMKNTLARTTHDDTEITFHFVFMSLNMKELPDYIRFVSSLGGNSVVVQELLPNSRFYDELKPESLFSQEEILEVVNQAKEAAAEEKMDLVLNLQPPFSGEVRSLPMRVHSKAPSAAVREVFMRSVGKIYPGFCNMAASYLKITPEGEVFPCCRAPDVLKMGDIRKNSFEEIWNGEAFQRFRRKMFQQDYEEVCRTCSVLTGNPHFKMK